VAAKFLYFEEIKPMKRIPQLILLVLLACQPAPDVQEEVPLHFSGVYPHLAFYNHEAECGTGAVVPWAGSLWAITYAPHQPNGSTDKLYQITKDLKQIVRDESIGGTPANRMIHRESGQLFIGPYVIDDTGDVRVIPYHEMQGRHTGNARHLSEPEDKIYYATMEEGFYEVQVDNLEVTMLYQDGNDHQGHRIEHDPTDVNPQNALLLGAHGKGLYSGQGVMVYANNGEASEEALRQFDIEAGVLAEWDGKDWKIVRRNQFTEVTGPGGIYGNSNPETDPIWSTGWDHKSLLLAVRDNGAWNFYRLPKASHSYDGAHGWNTEWPRIRDVGTSENPDYLMTMHGMFWKFPEHFTSSNSAGIRPRSAYLKVIGDFTRWHEKLVFGCDDSALREFLNKRKVKGNIEGPGQSNSNLWFTDPQTPDQLGPTTATGAVWLREQVRAGGFSEPFLFSGWSHRAAWLSNHGDASVELNFEVDRLGNGSWEPIIKVKLDADESKMLDLSNQSGEWIRLEATQDARLTAIFSYRGEDLRLAEPIELFRGLTKASEPPKTAGLLYGLGDDRRSLGISARFSNKPSGYYELGADMILKPKDDPQTQAFIDEKFVIPQQVVQVGEASILVVDDQDRRWRLPKGSKDFDNLMEQGEMRISREVATERDLFNCHGTFYELPAENADGFAKIRPISSHPYRIHDYASYRGLLVMTGVSPDQAAENHHVIVSEDGQAAVWVGTIDDLWKLGKPRGAGGPWYGDQVQAGVASDPYLIAFYHQKSMKISHESDQPVTFTIEVEPLGHGPWMRYQEIEVSPGETYQHQFPESFQARWIRFIADKDCTATAWLDYN
jgi:hypothetical protein